MLRRKGARTASAGKTAVAMALSASLAMLSIATPVAFADGDIETPEIGIGDAGGSSRGGSGSTATDGNVVTPEVGIGDVGGSSRGSSGSPATGRDVETPEVGLDAGGGNAQVGAAGYSTGVGYSSGGGYSTGSAVVQDGTSAYAGGWNSSSSSSDSGGSATTDVSGPWRRLGGADRYATMSAIVSAGFSRSDWAVVATGTTFPDALTASSLAGIKSCPVLLTDGQALSGAAKSQIERLGVRDVYLVGGEGAISAAVSNQIQAMGVGVHRIAGADRVATSVAAFREARAQGSASDTVIVATGDVFADALSVGSWSYATQSPILLARGGRLSEEALSAIRGDGRVSRVLILGGTQAVSETVEAQLGDTFEVVRLSGADRYETCSRIATWAAAHGLNTSAACVATGRNFPDALAGAALSGARRATMLLEDGSGKAAGWLNGNGAKVTDAYVLGGEAAVSQSVMAGLPR